MENIKHHKKICDSIFKYAGKKQAEVIIFSGESALTRFAENVISQNVSAKTLEITLRLIDKGRISRVSINQESDTALKSAVESAEQLLKMQKPDPHLLALPAPEKLPESANGFYPRTAEFTPQMRAAKIRELAAMNRRQTVCGTLSNGWTRVTVANSKEIFASDISTAATWSVTTRDGDGSGWAEQFSPDIAAIDFKKVNETASRKALLSKSPREIPPGKYTVILEPDPVANMLFWISYMGLSGQAFNEGQSFISGNLGKKILGGNITIEDNSLNGPSAGMPFDFEGLPRKKITLIKEGVAKAVAHDRKTAKQAGAKTTGHALPQPSPYGPLPANLVLKHGSASTEEMIKSTKRGILVTQFHYVNALKPKTLEITGMTRNGTFMIENGEIAYPVKNLRFTESVVGALNRVTAVGQEQVLAEAFFGGKFLVPALRIEEFNFSSTTKF